jgi:hypothetical protein
MRLGQLSRKINVSYSEILDYMDKDLGVRLDASLNAKIDDPYIKQIISHFAPELPAVETVEIEESTLIDQAEVSKEIDVDIAEGVSEEAIIDEVLVEQEEVEEEVEEIKKSGTIKAKAEKLEGLTVIGKIELPPPPPPEMIEVDGVMYEKEEIKKQRKEEKEQRRLEALKRKQAREEKPKFLPVEEKVEVKKVVRKRLVSNEELRQREEKAIELIKREEEKYRKEKQSKHYAEKHLINTPPPSKRNKSAKVTETKNIEIPAEDSNQPTTALGKFWRWLTTY